jgi:hypothetical protein
MAADPRFTEDASGVTYTPGPTQRIDLPTPDIGAQFRADGTIYTWDGHAWLDVPALAAAVRTQAEALAVARALLAEAAGNGINRWDNWGGWTCNHCRASSQGARADVQHDPDCLIPRIAAHLAAQAPAGGVEAGE